MITQNLLLLENAALKKVLVDIRERAEEAEHNFWAAPAAMTEIVFLAQCALGERKCD